MQVGRPFYGVRWAGRYLKGRLEPTRIRRRGGMPNARASTSKGPICAAPTSATRPLRHADMRRDLRVPRGRSPRGRPERTSLRRTRGHRPAGPSASGFSGGHARGRQLPAFPSFREFSGAAGSRRARRTCGGHFENAVLTRADLRGATLKNQSGGADLTQANLHAVLGQPDLTGAACALIGGRGSRAANLTGGVD
jgi:anti-sigma factor RsiW